VQCRCMKCSVVNFRRDTRMHCNSIECCFCFFWVNFSRGIIVSRRIVLIRLFTELFMQLPSIFDSFWWFKKLLIISVLYLNYFVTYLIYVCFEGDEISCGKKRNGLTINWQWQWIWESDWVWDKKENNICLVHKKRNFTTY